MKSYSPEQLEEIIERCQKGDRKYQQIVYELFYGKMMGVCMRYAGQRELAKDYLQDGFIKAFLKIEKFDFKGSFEGWLRRIIVNNIIDTMRKKRYSFVEIENMHDLYFVENNEEIEDENEIAYLKKLTTTEILDQVQLLSPAYRTVFNLYIVEGYSHKEIADMLKISEGSSKSNLARAKANMQKLLKKYYELKYGKIEYKNV
ncbi:MAG: RNA polymerase sigma factor [Bacteroidales bacterium]|nr:RNA polymerase sigma factor [Bacteroidales bacterium]